MEDDKLVKTFAIFCIILLAINAVVAVAVIATLADASTLTTSVTVTISDTPQIIKEAEYTAGVGVSAAVNLHKENEETTRILEANN